MRSLIGKKAPAIKATAVMDGNRIENGFSLDRYEGQKYVVLFFYPMDFTFVCPSEIIAFNKKLDEFKKRNCEVISVSIDSEYSHFAWKSTEPKKGGIGNVQFPMVADITKSISRNYEVLYDNAVALRGLFIIDKLGIVRHATINDLPLGRNVDEVLRTLDALQFTEKYGDVCPANWHLGEEGMKPTADGVADYLGKHE